MDTAVGLVEAYLNINGYFTVVEYPLVETTRAGRPRNATDVDVLAFRFPGAGCEWVQRGRRQVHGSVRQHRDPELGGDIDRADMIIAEVKEGTARFNRPMRDPRVLAAALTRFGCCPVDAVGGVVEMLLRHGTSETPGGHSVRMVAFGSRKGGGHHHIVPMAHVIAFLQRHLRERWSQLGHMQFGSRELSVLALLEKSARNDDAPDPPYESPPEDETRG